MFWLDEPLWQQSISLNVAPRSEVKGHVYSILVNATPVALVWGMHPSTDAAYNRSA